MVRVLSKSLLRGDCETEDWLGTYPTCVLISIDAIRSAALPSQRAGHLRSGGFDWTSFQAVNKVSFPGWTRRLVPSSIVIGRSVFGRTVRHVTPR